MTAWYNEIDADAAAILQALIEDKVIAPGVVDTRSIAEVMPDDLEGFDQCHFFAGGGLWSVAARLAGWPDDRPLWTGSCPCQPFSAAGKRAGTDDARHLWPHLHRLVRARRPAVVMGEQVAGTAGYGWFDGVRADLAGEGYACRAVDVPACAVDAPHQRNRLWWIAVVDAEGERRGEGRPEHAIRGGRDTVTGADLRGVEALEHADGASRRRRGGTLSRSQAQVRSEGVKDGREPDGPRDADAGDGQGVMADAEGERSGAGFRQGDQERHGPIAANSDGRDEVLGDALVAGLEGHAGNGAGWPGRAQPDRPASPADGGDAMADADGGGQRAIGKPKRAGIESASGRLADRPHQDWRQLRPNGSWWADAEWIICHDGKARRTKPDLSMLVDGLPGRVGLWRVAGNAISPVLAAEVIAAFMETAP